MKKWEYKSFNRQIGNNELNELGLKGWELVSHTAVLDHVFGQYYVFKRELL
jgi:hypothetical protein